ncbi:MAG: hypothetical protein R3290_10980 [Acidimicrobiia bacterium]|nr:hypothetical protein [Acidimicrobiia bacterium]
MRTIAVPSARLRALATGEIVVLSDAGEVAAGEQVRLVDGGTDGAALKPAYERWDGSPLAGEWSAEVIEVVDAAAFDADAFSARHVLAAHPAGRLAVLRVSAGDRPVLSDTAFDARRRSIAGARR